MICQPESPRIGGEFEFLPYAYKGGARTELAAEFARLHCLWTDIGRSALLIAASTIRHRGGKPRAWVPAFSCESISRPFRQAGFDLKYYSVGANLGGDNVSLPQPGVGDTLLFIHYFGHRNGYMSQVAQEYRAAGVWVIEDCVQGSLMQGLGESCDFAVTSYRKLLPVVDGAALLSGISIDLSAIGLQLAQADESFISAKLMGKIMRGANAAAEDFLPLFKYAEDRLQGHIIPRQMSWLSKWIVERLDVRDVIAKRRANWLAMLENILRAGLTNRVRPVFNTLRDGDVPLGLPVWVTGGRRDDLRRYLAGKEIYCPVHWPLGHLPDDEAFPIERALESSLLTLPVDQRMSPEHVERVVEELISFFSKTKPAQ